MNDPSCSDLDDYLDEQLPPGLRAKFQSHLAGCARCRREVELYTKTCALLRRATVEMEEIPIGLIDKIERQIGAAVPRRFAWIVPSAMAAAGLFVATLIWFANAFRRDDLRVATHVAHRQQATAPTTARDRETMIGAASGSQERIQISFGSAFDAIAVPVASDDPGVTIFWLYPTQSSANLPRLPEFESPERVPRSEQ